MHYTLLNHRFPAIFILMLWFSVNLQAQEVYFFSDGTDNTYYDQGIVDVNGLGTSTFEYTHPPGGPQWNDKIPCSSLAFKGSSSLKFNYTSSPSGNWRVSIFRSGWTTASISGLDSVSFYLYSASGLPATALPTIALKANKTSGSGDMNSKFYKLGDYNSSVPAAKWTRISFPIAVLKNDPENALFDYSSVKGVVFNQSENNSAARLFYIDELVAFKSIATVPPVQNLSATGYDSHTELSWNKSLDGLSYRVYASFDQGKNFELRTETSENIYLDFVSGNQRNQQIVYRVNTVMQGRESLPAEKTATLRDFTDDELLDLVQRYSFRYFWEGAHQATGMALERSNGNGRTAASGATGMGLMAMIVAHERQYQPREEVKDRILKILYFLENCDRFHGAWAHWYNADTYRATPFSTLDNGGDLVETSFVAQALIALKNYFSGTDSKSVEIRSKSEKLWREIDWTWYRQTGQNVLYWHWSPDYNFQMNMKVTGWNECLITYLMAAASPTFPIDKSVYEQGYARNGNMLRKRNFYGYEINLMPDWGGPLFWLHYTHLGINPHGLKDQYADYWQEFVNTAKIHHRYAVENPLNHKNYSDKCWGLTASDDPYGYTAHKPMNNDNGTISPTAALASMPYSPEESLKALKYFYRERGSELFGIYGPYDAFNDNLNWVKKAYLGIDQGPIVVMIENHRTGLLWNRVMKDEQVKSGLNKLGFQYQVSTSVLIPESSARFELYPNPATNVVHIRSENLSLQYPVQIGLFSPENRLVRSQVMTDPAPVITIDCSGLKNGIYILRLTSGESQQHAKLIIQK